MNALPEDAPRVLIVDDEPDLCELLAITLRGMGLQSDSTGTLVAARQALTDASYRLCLCDLRLPDGSGLELIEHIQRTQPHLPVAMITAHGDVGAAVAAMKAGAFDFVNKPVNVQGLRGLIDQALRLSRVRAEAGTVPSLIGESPAMQALRVMVAKLARSQAPVFIRGESGVGKERVARLIHAQGARASGPFVPVNCGAIPEHLLESELFGHVKGSFTGASADREGLFQTAAGGTLFLDEIGAVPPAMQVKLLRALQERAVRPVGARQEIPVDARVLSATHEDLAALVRDGRVRQDFYYRINVIEVTVPPLRDRAQDIPALAADLLARMAGGERLELTPAALTALQGYAFPGNVRELENILERAAALCEGPQIDRADLHLPAACEYPPQGGAGGDDLDAELDGVERARIVAALEATRYNRTAAAARLGLTLRQLRYRMLKLDLN
ncbi:sigma-54-dependent transcriptional regulator [Immundisolibacter cernigliae]|uniref:Sigma-54-dependent Fis family transcriptional regulator n=1 Tax=Immundisolibacter cernigliae TaxID=1810504 RepID=A0A1B1YTL8_9GAMM|nr:sigma-54 dependent transcriptional regulator [Immundisolibacter cernigliae]ANX04069.1 sigma-54-dependent Fis family transcriptional regulator [Immundisolibacter cernigliae]